MTCRLAIHDQEHPYVEAFISFLAELKWCPQVFPHSFDAKYFLILLLGFKNNRGCLFEEAGIRS
jgi:hypothetical protein